jgi:hypothetical protein
VEAESITGFYKILFLYEPACQQALTAKKRFRRSDANGEGDSASTPSLLGQTALFTCVSEVKPLRGPASTDLHASTDTCKSRALCTLQVALSEDPQQTTTSTQLQPIVQRAITNTQPPVDPAPTPVTPSRT